MTKQDRIDELESALDALTKTARDITNDTLISRHMAEISRKGEMAHRPLAQTARAKLKRLESSLSEAQAVL